MALPPAAPDRVLKHTRAIAVQVFARADGLWDVDARLSDVKTRDTPLGGGIRAAGEPIHDMLLRLVVDQHFNILESGAETLRMPYAGACDQHGDAYGRLVGLNLMKGFRAAARQRLGGVLGCTHITELCQVLPTAVLQGYVGEVVDPRVGLGADARPFQIDGCHALSAGSEVVRLHFPKWYRPPSDELPASDNPG